jgi:hypothetical protein
MHSMRVPPALQNSEYRGHSFKDLTFKRFNFYILNRRSIQVGTEDVIKRVCSLDTIFDFLLRYF